MKTHPCADRGHLWLEVVSGQPFVRHRGRSGLVPVRCQNCDATATLQSHAASTAGPGSPPMAPEYIPPAFLKVMERAMKKANEGTDAQP